MMKYPAKTNLLLIVSNFASDLLIVASDLLIIAANFASDVRIFSSSFLIISFIVFVKVEYDPEHVQMIPPMPIIPAFEETFSTMEPQVRAQNGPHRNFDVSVEVESLAHLSSTV